jgi:ABC-type multidrug transport system permease subunit
VLFNAVIALVQAAITILLGAWFLEIPVRVSGLPWLLAGVILGTIGWFFFYAIFALMIRRNDAFNTVTSVFYFVFLFASSMFYPLEPLPRLFQIVGYANPITWQVDVLRYATIGLGDMRTILLEVAGFVIFSVICFAVALQALRKQE